MLCRTHYIASWQVYLGDGSNALIVMEDISKMYCIQFEKAFRRSKDHFNTTSIQILRAI